jgi:hypothetical protein
VGRIVEVYDPNPWMTFGGMGSQKLIGANIEYIVNNDSHLGAPYNPEFRNLVKSEIARLSADQLPDTAQAQIPTKPPNSSESPKPYLLQPAARR